MPHHSVSRSDNRRKRSTREVRERDSEGELDRETDRISAYDDDLDEGDLKGSRVEPEPVGKPAGRIPNFFALLSTEQFTYAWSLPDPRSDERDIRDHADALKFTLESLAFGQAIMLVIAFNVLQSVPFKFEQETYHMHRQWITIIWTVAIAALCSSLGMCVNLLVALNSLPSDAEIERFMYSTGSLKNIPLILFVMALMVLMTGATHYCWAVLWPTKAYFIGALSGIVVATMALWLFNYMLIKNVYKARSG